MATHEPMRKLKDQMIEENLRKAFEDKAGEDVPDELLSLLEQLKQQDDTDGRR